MSFESLWNEIDKFDLDRNRINLSPSDLAKSIVIESVELLEHFQWDDTLRNRWNRIESKNMEDIWKEMWDIVSYIFKFCREMNIDIAKVTSDKIKENEKKYPIDYKKSETDDLDHEEYLKIKKTYRSKK